MAANPDYDAPRRQSVGEIADAPVLPAALFEGPDRAGRVDSEEFERADLVGQRNDDDGLRALSMEDLTMPVQARRVDEAICVSCFLVYPKSRLLARTVGRPVCHDCA